MTQASRGRQGDVFTLRMTADERATLEGLHRRDMTGPRSLGPWMLARALGNTRARGNTALGGNTPSSASRAVIPPPAGPPLRKRVILDLCAGTGAWSEPYREAGYQVVRITLPKHDVRTFKVPSGVWGVLAAPPCEEFSIAKNGHPTLTRDVTSALEIVGACLRIVVAAKPQWWALENPVGLLAGFLGKASDTWEPCDFGDPWTKRTGVWGRFERPRRSYVKPIGSGPLCLLCDPGKRRSGACSNVEHRARTPSGFARAFFEANR